MVKIYLSINWRIILRRKREWEVLPLALCVLERRPLNSHSIWQTKIRYTRRKRKERIEFWNHDLFLDRHHFQNQIRIRIHIRGDHHLRPSVSPMFIVFEGEDQGIDKYWYKECRSSSRICLRGISGVLSSAGIDQPWKFVSAGVTHPEIGVWATLRNSVKIHSIFGRKNVAIVKTTMTKSKTKRAPCFCLPPSFFALNADSLSITI